MPEIQLGAHTIRSHGARVARLHMHDWLILMLLVVIEIILNVINPFYRFVGEDMMTDLKYPLKDNTVPFWAVPVCYIKSFFVSIGSRYDDQRRYLLYPLEKLMNTYSFYVIKLIAVVLPLTVIITFYFIRRDVYDLHQATLGLLFSVLITGVLTDAIKDGVGRPRPDFFWRCFPDGVGVFHNITGNVQCTGLKSIIKEGHKSFPSGHTSWSFAGLGFLAWYLSGKIKVFDRRGHIAKLCIIFVPLLLAALVAVSRVDDYWHHWQDVFAGSLLGLTVASFCYLQFFPPPYDVDGWAPHAYFNMLAESQTENRSSLNNANRLSVAPSELESVYIHSHSSEANAPGSNSILEDMETQRRH